jgi:AraC-like DNA-binding protein
MLTPAGDLELGGGGAVTRFLCAGYDYDHEVAQPLMSALPAVLHVPAAQISAGDPGGSIAATLRMLALELSGRAPGSATVVDRLIDLLFVHVLRAWLAEPTAGGPGADRSWLAGLRDPTTSTALGLLHAQPGRPWSADQLARAVGVSRATLVRRFQDRIGQPPMSYLTAWRMDLAARALRNTDQPVDVIAREVGYTSEFAFSRAFARSRGEPPGRYRHGHRRR